MSAEPIIRNLILACSTESQKAMREILARTSWAIDLAASVAEVRTIRSVFTSVIITESELPDGTWSDCLGEAIEFQRIPRVIVTSRLADERFWADVLNRGGFDVLAQPFEPDETLRILESAFRNWEGGGREIAEGAR